MPARPAASTSTAPTTPEIDALVAQLTLEERCAMVVGRDLWTIPGCERLGIPDWTVSDGPVGVRGRLAGPGLVVPGPSALAATWDPVLVAEVGAALGQECVDKHVDLLLAPTVNLHQSPRNGRHFESYSEDPELSARTGVAYIQGVQSHGVGACVKHFVCNDQETDRFTIDVQVDERALREIYLPPFEAAVRDGGVRSVMGAYSFVNGHHACAQPDLLVGVLKGEWGFRGFVISDWDAIKETVAPARHGLDVEMPGSGRWWGRGQLQAAVESGAVPEVLVDDMVRRVLTFLDWRGRLQATTESAEAPIDRPEHHALVRRAAAEATVLLHNARGVLPLRAGQTVALIGPGAAETALLGGGSASLQAHHRTDVLTSLQARWEEGRVTTALGARLRRRVASLPPEWIDGAGLVAELHAGPAFLDEPTATFAPATAYNLWTRGGEVWPAATAELVVRLRATVVAPTTGRYRAMAAGIGQAVLHIDGVPIAENTTDPVPVGLALRGGVGEVELEGGRSYEVVLEHTNPGGRAIPAVVLDLGLELVPPPEDDLIEEAARRAAAADVAVVVVGTSDEWETEGADREHLELPRGQDELVRRVAAANPNTVVVLNCGAPTPMPWLDDVGAVLLAWYPGQEGGDAIVDVLVGEVDPGGRMPTTWARREADTPAYLHFPGEAGTVRYGESIYVGYRWYDARRIEPLVPFGHGGSYATFEWDRPTVSGSGTDLVVEVPVHNTSDRPGTEVVQVYVAPGPGPVHRPVKELAGFAKLRLPAGAGVARIALRERAFARWDLGTHAWVVDPGRHRLLVAASATDVRFDQEVVIDG